MNRAIVGILSVAVTGVVGDAFAEERPQIHEPLEVQRRAPLKSRKLGPPLGQTHPERPRVDDDPVEAKPEHHHSDRPKGSGSGGARIGGLDVDFDDE